MCRQYHYISVDAIALTGAQAEYEGIGNTQPSLLDISKSTADLSQTENGFALIIIRLHVLESDVMPTIARDAKALLSDVGQILLVEHNTSADDLVAVESPAQVCDMVETSATVHEANGFHNIRHMSCAQSNANRPRKSSQLITSIAVPQQATSQSLVDARFGGLCSGDTLGAKGSDSEDGWKEIQALFLIVKGGVDHQTVLEVTDGVVNRLFMTILRLSDAMEPREAAG